MFPAGGIITTRLSMTRSEDPSAMTAFDVENLQAPVADAVCVGTPVCPGAGYISQTPGIPFQP